MLASFLVQRASLPFTLGIYGAWGEGKTTFANLLVHYLRVQPEWEDASFIPFSAWPYVTADAIWRALLDSIAREVFDIPDGADDADGVVETVRDRLRVGLATQPFTLHRAVKSENRQLYERLLRRFEKSSAVANRTLADGNAAKNLSALAELVVDAAATVSPGLGSLRRFLGLGPSAPESGTGLPAGEAVRSVEEIRDVLTELFSHRPQLKLIVLLDDLDRCLPEVALDVLETIKIFFFESARSQAQCLFIVAADEALIARGLRARLGDDADDQIAARQYLEKIVQLRVAVPDVDVSNAHRLIATTFPEWALTTDLIAAGLGQNPRRLKQQCNVMSYRFRAQEESERRARRR